MPLCGAGKEIARLVRAERGRRGWTQEKLAEVANVNRLVVYGLENPGTREQRRMQRGPVERVLAALNIHPSVVNEGSR